MIRRNPWTAEQTLGFTATSPILAAALSAASRTARLPDPGAESMVFTGPLPSDPLFGRQWHLSATNGADINLRSVWSDFTGRGIKVAVVDDGFDTAHLDLRASYDTALDFDWRARDADATGDVTDRHGTAVMGTIGADANTLETIGVAADAVISGLRIGYGSSGSASQYASALRDGARFDVVNNSWGYSDHFRDNFNNFAFSSSESALVSGTTSGRGGLGTVYVFAAGNARGTGDNVNHHNYGNNIQTIAVGATDSAGRIASFSTPGAPILVSAPGVGILTTDVTGANGYSGGNSASLSGTSFATPIVAGVVALMLDANAALGWRDVHEILAYSARLTDPLNATWRFNQAGDWNGGGLHTSTNFGFGLVDAHGAVRLAETWGTQATSANMFRASASAAPNLAVPDPGLLVSTLAITQDVRVDRIELWLDLRHGWRGDVVVSLVSPGGTESVLINRPGVAWGGNGSGSSMDNIVFDLTSTQFWGEQGRGVWTLRVQDLVGNAERGTLASWRLDVVGDRPSANSSYVYTDEFTTLGADPARRVLSDTAGVDTINAAAVTTGSVIDLVTGATIAGRAITFAAGTVIERAIAGDGADAVRGNAADNRIWGGRGDDVLAGRGGADVFVFGVSSGRDVIEDFALEDAIWLSAGVTVASLTDSVATLSDGATLTAANGWVWTAADFVAQPTPWLV